MRRILHLSVLLLSAGQAQAMADFCDDAALRAAAETGVPPALMLAITRVETGRDGAPWPWTLNVDGTGHFYASAAETASAAEAAIAAGASQVDVGCFQLNLQWHGAAFDSLTEMVDPEANARYAARFLSDLYAETGDWRAAAAAYHSRTEERGTAYVARIEAAHAALSAPDMPSTPPATRPNRFPLLISGGTGAAGSLVPTLGHRLPLIGGP